MGDFCHTVNNNNYKISLEPLVGPALSLSPSALLQQVSWVLLRLVPSPLGEGETRSLCLPNLPRSKPLRGQSKDDSLSDVRTKKTRLSSIRGYWQQQPPPSSGPKSGPQALTSFLCRSPDSSLLFIQIQGSKSPVSSSSQTQDSAAPAPSSPRPRCCSPQSFLFQTQQSQHGVLSLASEPRESSPSSSKNFPSAPQPLLTLCQLGRGRGRGRRRGLSVKRLQIPVPGR